MWQQIICGSEMVHEANGKFLNFLSISEFCRILKDKVVPRSYPVS